jgi:hypothetical protein
MSKNENKKNKNFRSYAGVCRSKSSTQEREKVTASLASFVLSYNIIEKILYALCRLYCYILFSLKSNLSIHHSKFHFGGAYITGLNIVKVFFQHNNIR